MKNTTWLCILLVIATIMVYFQTGDNAFIYFDDNVYVEKNLHVTSGLTRENIVWAFTRTHAANWHPITWLSHMLDCQIYGLDPRGHHLTSVFIHALSTLLLFLLLTRITTARWQSLFVAALFALHPLHVESVAWVAERKDVLSGLFCFITLYLYADYAETRNWKTYIMTVCSFVVGLMSKSMLVALPLVMLFLDYWPLRRIQQYHPTPSILTPAIPRLRNLVFEKIPFLLFSILSSAITIYAQHTGTSLVSLAENPLGPRLGNALVSYAQYVIKMFLPYNLAIFYPFKEPPFWQVLASLLFIAGISLLSYRLRRHFPYLLIGWLWFMTTLLPVIGIIQVGDQSMADRYTYLPYIGLFIMLSWGIPDLLARFRYRAITVAFPGIAILCACLMLTWHQLSYWRNDTTLFTHAINVTQNNYKAHHALGVTLARQGDFEKAFQHLSEAIRIIPTAETPYYDMGVALEASKRADEAVPYYLKVISMNPDNVAAHTQIGGIFCREGHYAEAFEHFSTALHLNPEYYPARLDLQRCRNMSPKSFIDWQ